MKIFSATVVVSGLVGTAALALLVLADRQLGVPIPYAISCVVAMLNITAALAITVPRRTVVATTVGAKPFTRHAAVNAPTVRPVAAAPIDEAVVWFETVAATPRQEAA